MENLDKDQELVYDSRNNVIGVVISSSSGIGYTSIYLEDFYIFSGNQIGARTVEVAKQRIMELDEKFN